jgi:hypothetical protein
MKKFKEYLEEAFFKVKIPDVAPTFVEAGSASEVKTNMRKVLKPDVVADLEIERVTPAEIKKMYRDMAQGKDEVEESNVDALKLALAKYKFKKKGGKVDKQPDSLERTWGKLSPQDKKRAEKIAQYKKDKKNK